MGCSDLMEALYKRFALVRNRPEAVIRTNDLLGHFGCVVDLIFKQARTRIAANRLSK